MDRVRPGSVRKMSMGYSTLAEDFVDLKDYGKTRNLRKVALGEGSLVIFPMNNAADVNRASVKALSAALADGSLTEAEVIHEIKATLSQIQNPKELRALASHIGSVLKTAAPPAQADEGEKSAEPDPADIRRAAVLRQLQLRNLTKGGV